MSAAPLRRRQRQQAVDPNAVPPPPQAAPLRRRRQQAVDRNSVPPSPVAVAARTVTGFQPEGVHLTQWTASSILVSWQTGVAAYVKLGTAPGRYHKTAKGKHSLVYRYVYGPDAGNTTYQSPILHHVLLRGLKPGKTYFYVVGNEDQGWSQEFNFTTLRQEFPIRLGLVGDLGQTSNTSTTLQQLVGSKPDMVVLTGDFSYADDHLSGDSSGEFSGGTDNAPTSDQPRWDSWARLAEPVLSKLPLISCRGNHEREPLLLDRGNTFVAPNARFPYPQARRVECVDPSEIDTSSNVGAEYLNLTNPREFLNESRFQPSSAYYSLDLPGIAHIIPWGNHSAQVRWLRKDLAKVDRGRTPWLIVIFHVPPYHTYNTHYKARPVESDTFMTVVEDIFYEHQVDLVFNGHVHAYERTYPV
ncbi:hypothetical protein CHLNCDRAFT_144837 [Chlorella variabilis]|uniref:Purple acid phosphatase n=1 Tax=Chlorella variabilis TaxID=554065 RepID=E1ZD44_CHLVA|nr:hypothetical protein CHLNCDRAFT_144837 [Chlorella variabilis]EFN56155.1 hypothetical protein CHLNCDRAFT_144837 [Chlorella variabilis]|eukprot:XP_005848257.1 hypothetical protein CHLNCDRAFT_144837 [Chlorella variabilis]